MPVLTAAVTVLALTGTPGEPGGPYSHGEATTVNHSVSDTLRPVITEGPFSDLEIALDDEIVPVVGNTAIAGRNSTISDTIRPVITDAYTGLAKSGALPKAASDSVVPVITESVFYVVSVGVSDSVVPVITDAQSLSSADALEVSDSIIPVITETSLTEIRLGAQSFSVYDTVTPVVRDAGLLGTFQDVDEIEIVMRPFYQITLNEV